MNKKIFCIVSGDELLKNGNGNGNGKEKRKQAVLSEGLCKINCITERLESIKEDNLEEGTKELKKAIQTLKDMKEVIKKIDEENGNDNHGRDCSYHHPAKRAVFKGNDFVLPMRKDLHVSLENDNITPAENMLLGLMLPMYAEINTRFIISRGSSLPRSELVDIVIGSIRKIRGIPEKELRRKLQRRIPDPDERMRHMLNAKGIKIPREGQY